MGPALLIRLPGFEKVSINFERGLLRTRQGTVLKSGLAHTGLGSPPGTFPSFLRGGSCLLHPLPISHLLLSPKFLGRIQADNLSESAWYTAEENYFY